MRRMGVFRAAAAVVLAVALSAGTAAVSRADDTGDATFEGVLYLDDVPLAEALVCGQSGPTSCVTTESDGHYSIKVAKLQGWNYRRCIWVQPGTDEQRGLFSDLVSSSRFTYCSEELPEVAAGSVNSHDIHRTSFPFVYGQVLAPSGAPIEGATVATAISTSSTGADGRFQVRMVRQAYDDHPFLKISAPGYASAWTYWAYFNPQLGPIMLAKSGRQMYSINGTVLNRDGSPAAGAKICAASNCFATADADGRYVGLLPRPKAYMGWKLRAISTTGLVSAAFEVTAGGNIPLVEDFEWNVDIQLGVLVAPRPVVLGAAKVGAKLTAYSIDWGPGPVTLRYQWLADGQPIARATKPTFKITKAQRGKRLRLVVTGTPQGYQTIVRKSLATRTVR